MGAEMYPFYRHILDEITLNRAMASLKEYDLNSTASIIHAQPVSLDGVLKVEAQAELYKCLSVYPSKKDVSEYLSKTEQLFETLHGIKGTALFEIRGNSNSIQFSFTANEEDIKHIESVVNNFYPNAITYIDEIDIVSQNLHCYSFIPARPFYYSFTDYLNYKISPLNSIARLFMQITESAIGIYQVMFKPLAAQYHDYVKRAVDISWNSLLPIDSKTPPSLFPNTIAKRLEYKSLEFGSYFAVTIKIFLPDSIPKEEVIACMSHYTYGSAKLIYLEPSLFKQDQVFNMFNKQRTYHNGFVVNTHELTGFSHVLYEVLSEQEYKNKVLVAPAGDIPQKLTNYDGVSIGHWKCGKKELPVFLPSVFDIAHAHCMGVSRSGKSTLLLHMILKAYQKGKSCIVLDFHGDLTKSIQKLVTKDMFKDTIVIDFGRKEIPVLSLKYNFDTNNPSRMADNLTMSMRDVGTAEKKWFGPRMVYVLYCIFYVLSITDLQLADLSILLSKSNRGENLRKKIKDKITHPIIYNFLNDFSKSSYESVAPVVTRLSHLLLDERSLKFFSIKDHKISIQEILNQPPKLCLINLSIGELGLHRSAILSGVIEGMIINNMLARSIVPYHLRNEVLLVKDEFYLSSVDISLIIAGLAKYGLNLIVANQHFSQVEPHVRDALTTAGTRIMFKVQQRDADVLAKDFGISSSEFVNLPQFHAVVKCDDEVVKIHTPLPKNPENDLSEQLMRYCLDRYYLNDVKDKPKNKILTFDSYIGGLAMTSFQEIIQYLHPDVILQLCDIPNDEARACYPIERITVSNYREFEDAILDYIKHHTEKVYGTACNDIVALSIAQNVLGELPRQAFVGLSGADGGITSLFNKINDDFKKTFKKNYFQLVMNELIDPLIPEEKIALMQEFKEHLSEYAPSSFDYLSAEAMGADYRNIIWQYLEGLARFRNLYRYY